MPGKERNPEPCSVSHQWDFTNSGSGVEYRVKKILMLYPEFPNTFWSFKHALNFVRKRAGGLAASRIADGRLDVAECVGEALG